jgi:TolB-like protein/cytochrome c-type biogenesis protein CcmH/NrfG
MANLAEAYAIIGQKDSALKAAERAIMLMPRGRDPVVGPRYEENRAFIHTIFGDNSRAISALTLLLQTSYDSWLYHPTPITPALLRLDPIWDPLRSDPAFQKLCEEKIDRSIAVLPFENLSSDPDNAYFAEGIQEEILTRLAKIADLKVISRTSTQRYQSKPTDLGEIAKQLGVANILEGSVQKAAGQVRVNVQLINAQTDSHLWAESYDRNLTNIFGVESEIAKRIAESLRAKLSGQEEQELAIKPTNNPDAYDAYMRGVAFEARSHYSATPSMALVWEAGNFYERAVQLDPEFAIAWARLSRAQGTLYFNDGGATARDLAKRALDNAQRLEPNEPETLFALGYYQYWVLRDYGSAEITLERVRKLLPGSSEILLALSRVIRREGHWDQSLVYQEQAIALDPHNVQLLMNAAWGHAMLRRFTAALKLYDRALDITPNDPDVTAAKADIYQAQGKVQEAAKLLTEINGQTPSDEALRIKITQFRLERNYSEAVRLLQMRLAEFPYETQGLGHRPYDQVSLALAQLLAGDARGARVTAEQARNTLEPLYREDPDYHLATALSKIYAVLGEKDAALKAAEHGVMLLPRGKDAVWGPSLEENLAFIETIFGEKSRAIAVLTSLLQTPYSSARYNPASITAPLLRLDPIWDPLRGDPAFQKLCEEKRP